MSQQFVELTGKDLEAMATHDGGAVFRMKMDRPKSTRLALKAMKDRAPICGVILHCIEEMKEKILFIGDSPNDEPLYAGFAHSIAVGNLRRFLPRITHLPEFIAEGETATGFCEAAATILEKRGAV